jgi:lipoprotein-anchoring transpeptidase ErfK/SrfK
VGHGENDKTPIAEFTVAEKQPRPEWTAPDGNRYPYGHPQNILGEYFIKFRHDRYTGFGAHGTPMPETICTMSSMGCIRMLAPDIADLFLLLPRGAKVYIRASQSMT